MRARVLLVFAAACAAPPLPLQRDARALDADVRRVVAELGPGARAAVWLAAADGPPAYAWNADLPMPTASAIKAAYLIELFVEFAADLDAPLPGADALLADAAHPAVRDFRPPQRSTARRALGHASVRRVGEAMIQGKGVDNATYNLAANVVTAHFGGPSWLQARLHRRDRGFAGLHVRRYMLADRAVDGDNEATARALAAVHSLLASGRGLPPAAAAAARSVLAQGDDARGRHRFAKGGSLDSDPVTRVRAGFVEGPQATVVFVVMLAQDGVADGQFADAGRRLAAAAQRIEELLLAAAP